MQGIIGPFSVDYIEVLLVQYFLLSYQQWQTYTLVRVPSEPPSIKKVIPFIYDSNNFFLRMMSYPSISS